MDWMERMINGWDENNDPVWLREQLGVFIRENREQDKVIEQTGNEIMALEEENKANCTWGYFKKKEAEWYEHYRLLKHELGKLEKQIEHQGDGSCERCGCVPCSTISICEDCHETMMKG
jgi:hypothetical protein